MKRILGLSLFVLSFGAAAHGQAVDQSPTPLTLACSDGTTCLGTSESLQCTDGAYWSAIEGSESFYRVNISASVHGAVCAKSSTGYSCPNGVSCQTQ